jgi:hypothetical protein
MNMQSLATKLAAVPDRAREGLSHLPANPWAPRPTWPVGPTLAAIGLGLAIGVAIGLLLQVGPLSEERDPDSDGERA